MSETTSIFAVEGMTCGSCVRHIRKVLEPLPGVRSVNVQMREGEVLVLHDATAIAQDKLAAAMSDAGYAARKLARGESARA